MSYDPDNEIEQIIEIESSIVQSSFRRGLIGGWYNYLNELEKRAIDEFEGKEELMLDTFFNLRQIIERNPNDIPNLYKCIDLDSNLIARLGYLIVTMDSSSPTNANNNNGDHNRTFNSTKTIDSAKTMDSTKTMSSTIRSIRSDGGRSDDYEDDFEDEHDDDDYRKDQYLSHKIDNHKDNDRIINNRYRSLRASDKDIKQEEIDFEEDMDIFEDINHCDSPGIKSSNVAPQKVATSKLTIGAKASGVSRPHSTGTAYQRRTDTTEMKEPQNSESFGIAARSFSAGAQGRRKVTATPSWITKNEWKLGQRIGTGSFGEVFQCMSGKGKLYAAKRLNIVSQVHTREEIEELCEEIEFMKNFSHDYIVGYIGTWVDEKMGLVYIFQDWMSGGSVAHLLKLYGPFKCDAVKSYTCQMLKGLVYLHQNGIIHRDIKGGNVLVDEHGTVKLADFGASTRTTSFGETQVTSTIKGTPYFMAPEVLMHSKYGRKGDIWAVGCTMIQMLTGEPPWKDRNIQSLVQLHMLLMQWNKGPPPYDCEVTPECRECLEFCFIKNEADRPKASQLLECKFFTDELEESVATIGELEDSGIMSGLKEQMARVLSRASFQAPDIITDDTMGSIDRKLKEKLSERPNSNDSSRPQSNESRPQSNDSSRPPNPFARNSPSRASHNGPLRQVNTQNLETDVESADTPPLRLSTPGSNPFARGNGISPVRVTAPSVIRKVQTYNKKSSEYDDNDEEVAELDVIPNKNKSTDKKDYTNNNNNNNNEFESNNNKKYEVNSFTPPVPPESVKNSTEWQCLNQNCGNINHISLNYCEKCATNKGRGLKGVNASIVKTPS